MNVIVAVCGDWGIGYKGKQPIVISEDRRFFKEMTGGGVVIAGRKTFEEFPGPLSNRKNIILTQEKDLTAEGIVVAHSVDEVLKEIADESPDRVFVVGGGDTFRLFLPMCAKAYVTRIEAAPPSDTFFPDLDQLPEWTLELRGTVRESEGVRFSYNIYRNTNVIK